MAHTQRLYMLTAYTQVDTTGQILSALFLCTITRTLITILTMRIVIGTTRSAITRGRCASVCVCVCGEGAYSGGVGGGGATVSRPLGPALRFSELQFENSCPGGPLGWTLTCLRGHPKKTGLAGTAAG